MNSPRPALPPRSNSSQAEYKSTESPGSGSPDAGASRSESTTPMAKATARRGCLRAALAFAALVMVVIVVWGVFRAIDGAANQPDVDPNKIKPIEIGQADANTQTEQNGGLAEQSGVARFLRENPPSQAIHPLDPLLEMAQSILDRIESDVNDYTATLVNRERIRGKLLEAHYMSCKIRHGSADESGPSQPFAVYLDYLRPESARGREVIWVEGENNNNMFAHEGGIKNVLTLRLKPDGIIAMMNSRYPISNIGIQQLMRRLIEIGKRDRAFDSIVVEVQYDVTVNERPCTRIEVRHEVQRPDSDFHIAEIFIDNELELPVRYSAYDWPPTEGEEPPLIEQYTYLDLKLNVGLTDEDFDTDNPEYRFR